MSKKPKCLYTNMLNRLTMLDEQIFKMQADLAKVREMVNSRVDAEFLEEADQIEETTDKGEKE